jgi:hypothetical protein
LIKFDKRNRKMPVASFVPQGSFAQTATGLPLLSSAPLILHPGLARLLLVSLTICPLIGL